MRVAYTPQRLRVLAPLLRGPARRAGAVAARCVANSGSGASGDAGKERANADADAGDADARPSTPYSKLAAPPEDWPYGLYNPRHALGLRGVSLGMLRLRAGEAAAAHMHRHVHQEEVYSVVSGVAEVAVGSDRSVLNRGDVLRVAPGEPRALRALPAGPENPSGEDLRVLIAGGSTLGGPFPHDARSRALLDDRLSLFACLPPWLPPGSPEAEAAAALNAAQEQRELEHTFRMRWRVAERTAKLEAAQARRVAANAEESASRVFTVLVSAIALLDDKGRVLLGQRPLGKAHALKFEYPGGKVERGESPQAGLRRELAEELDIAVHPDDMFPLTFSCEGSPRSHLVIMLFGARRWEGTPRGAEGQPVLWVTPEQLGSPDFPMPPADIPMIPAVRAAMRAAAAGYSDTSTAAAALGALGADGVHSSGPRE